MWFAAGFLMKRLVVLHEIEPNCFLFQDPVSPFSMGEGTEFSVFATQAKQILTDTQETTATAAFESAGPEYGPALKRLSDQIGALIAAQTPATSGSARSSSAAARQTIAPPTAPTATLHTTLSTSWDQIPAQRQPVRGQPTGPGVQSHFAVTPPTSAVLSYGKSTPGTDVNKAVQKNGAGFYNVASRNVPNLDTFKTVLEIHRYWYHDQSGMPSLKTLETVLDYRKWRKNCEPALATRVSRIKKVARTLELIAAAKIFATDAYTAAAALDVEIKCGYFVSAGSGVASFFEWLWKAPSQRSNYRAPNSPSMQRITDDMHAKLSTDAAAQNGKRKQEKSTALEQRAQAKRQRMTAKQAVPAAAPVSGRSEASAATPTLTSDGELPPLNLND
jgi:hypothetical protein